MLWLSWLHRWHQACVVRSFAVFIVKKYTIGHTLVHRNRQKERQRSTFDKNKLNFSDFRLKKY